MLVVGLLEKKTPCKEPLLLEEKLEREKPNRDAVYVEAEHSVK